MLTVRTLFAWRTGALRRSNCRTDFQDPSILRAAFDYSFQEEDIQA
jgi:hypothetical protein